MHYEIEVVERRTYKVVYLIEAESEEEAIEKASWGETVDEFDEELIECGDRDPIEDTIEEAKPRFGRATPEGP